MPSGSGPTGTGAAGGPTLRHGRGGWAGGHGRGGWAGGWPLRQPHGRPQVARLGAGLVGQLTVTPEQVELGVASRELPGDLPECRIHVRHPVAAEGEAEPGTGNVAGIEPTLGQRKRLGVRRPGHSSVETTGDEGPHREQHGGDDDHHEQDQHARIVARAAGTPMECSCELP